MAKTHKPLDLPANKWIPANSEATNEISFVVTAGSIEVRAGQATSPPDETMQGTGWPYKEGQGEQQIPLTDITYAGGDTLFIRRTSTAPAVVVVDYA